MKAIVLGATGFIGSHVVRALLKEGIDVRILRRSKSPLKALEGLKMEETIGDLSNVKSLKKAFKGCGALFHVAGYYPLVSWDGDKQKELAFRQMQNVIEAVSETSSLERVVYTSSMSTIGKAKRGLAHEDTPYDTHRFKGLYYEIKYELEMQIFEAVAHGLPFVIVNPTGVFGDYDVKPTSGNLVVQIAKGRLPFIFDAKMNAVDVRDAASAHVAAMKKGKVGERYILGGHNTTLWAVSHLIARLAGARPPMARLPLVLGRWASFASECASHYLFHQDRTLVPRVGIDFLQYGMHYDTRKAQRKLGLKATPLQQTFERALGWFKKEGYV